MIKYFPKINIYLILFEFLHLKMLIFVVLSRWSRKLMQNKRAIFIRAGPNIFHWDTSIPNPEAHTWSVTSLMVAAHTMHADIYQVQLCNRMKRCRTIKTSASMAVDVRHTYFFVSLRNSISARDIRYNQVETRPCWWNGFRRCKWLQQDHMQSHVIQD